MRNRQIATIARYTLLEALRTRLPWLFAVVLALVLVAAYFIQQLAITESTRLQIGFSAAATRLAAVFVLSLHVVTSLVREFNDKGLELTLSFDLRRSHYILGRLCGFTLIALLLALIATLPQLLLAPPQAALQWGLSLALELAIVTALSLFCIVTFTQLMPAASFVLGFYLLARALTAIRLMSDTPLVGGGTPSHQVISLLVDALALVLPALDRFTQSAWLADSAASWPALEANAVQALIYTVLLAAAAMFDFSRRNL
jgi:ABC-type transport system involved in multi-copper enzyme maturation permease subunit